METEIKRVFLVKEAFCLISASERKRNRKLLVKESLFIVRLRIT